MGAASPCGMVCGAGHTGSVAGTVAGRSRRRLCFVTHRFNSRFHPDFGLDRRPNHRSQWTVGGAPADPAGHMGGMLCAGRCRDAAPIQPRWNDDGLWHLGGGAISTLLGGAHIAVALSSSPLSSSGPIPSIHAATGIKPLPAQIIRRSAESTPRRSGRYCPATFGH